MASAITPQTGPWRKMLPRSSTERRKDSAGCSGRRSPRRGTARKMTIASASETAAAIRKPVRQPTASASAAKGVPERTMPTPLTAVSRAARPPKRAGGKRRETTTRPPTNMAEQPAPISSCAATRPAAPPAWENRAAPALAIASIAAMTRRGP